MKHPSVPDGQWECDEYGWATPKLGGSDPDREALDACIAAGAPSP